MTHTPLHTAIIPSPVGMLILQADADALASLRIHTGKQAPVPTPPEADNLPLRHTRAWLTAYFAGAPLPPIPHLRPAGTPFRRRVWAELHLIKYGHTMTYGELAARLNNSPRAVGQAVGDNPIAILVPCHRVVGAGGRLTGFAYGVECKAQLLRLEGSLIKEERNP